MPWLWIGEAYPLRVSHYPLQPSSTKCQALRHLHGGQENNYQRDSFLSPLICDLVMGWDQDLEVEAHSLTLVICYSNIWGYISV